MACGTEEVSFSELKTEILKHNDGVLMTELLDQLENEIISLREFIKRVYENKLMDINASTDIICSLQSRLHEKFKTQTEVKKRKRDDANDVQNKDVQNDVTCFNNLSCPICQEAPNTSYIGCKKGHIVCKNCRDSEADRHGEYKCCICRNACDDKFMQDTEEAFTFIHKQRLQERGNLCLNCNCYVANSEFKRHKTEDCVPCRYHLCTHGKFNGKHSFLRSSRDQTMKHEKECVHGAGARWIQCMESEGTLYTEDFWKHDANVSMFAHNIDFVDVDVTQLNNFALEQLKTVVDVLCTKIIKSEDALRIFEKLSSKEDDDLKSEIVHHGLPHLLQMMDCEFGELAQKVISNLAYTKCEVTKLKIVNTALKPLVEMYGSCQQTRITIGILSESKNEYIKTEIGHAALPSLFQMFDKCKYARITVLNLSTCSEENVLKIKISSYMSQLVQMYECKYVRKTIGWLSCIKDNSLISTIINAALPSIIQMFDKCVHTRKAIQNLCYTEDDTLRAKISDAALPSLVLMIGKCEYGRKAISNLCCTRDDTLKAKIIDAAMPSIVSMIDKCEYARQAIFNLSFIGDNTLETKIVDAALPSLVSMIDKCEYARKAICVLCCTKDDMLKSKIIDAALPSLQMMDNCEIARATVERLQN